MGERRECVTHKNDNLSVNLRRSHGAVPMGCYLDHGKIKGRQKVGKNWRPEVKGD